MSTPPEQPIAEPPRRSFAARYRHRAWGIVVLVLAFFTFLIALVVLVPAEDGQSGGPGGFVFAAIFVALGVYLLRGQGLKPGAAVRHAQRAPARAERARLNAERRVRLNEERAERVRLNAERRAALEREAAARTQAVLDQTKQRLAQAEGRGAALVAFRELQATAKRLYPHDAEARVGQAVTDIGFDYAKISSPHLGNIYPLQRGPALEFFAAWVIFGTEAHDVEPSTRGQVYVDGTVHVIPRVTKKGKHYQETQDLRTAELQLTSASWSLRVPIKPDDANEARRLVGLLGIHAEQLGPRAVSREDIREMVDAILRNTGQPAAEKLTQLSNLRYNRLLNDEEFESAKAKILGSLG